MEFVFGWFGWEVKRRGGGWLLVARADLDENGRLLQSVPLPPRESGWSGSRVRGCFASRGKKKKGEGGQGRGEGP